MADENEQDEGIELALRYAHEIADLADRMEADGDRLHNRGEWNAAVWLLRRDVRDKLAAFIGGRVMWAAEHTPAEIAEWRRRLAEATGKGE